ncbi:GtrA family protein [Bacillus sp. JJ1764]|uniref:GtrA family protein n=1 Tax=Bacillus sp. JJ1764 TaxID=3122964 RepID=UPI002FFF5DA4
MKNNSRSLFIKHSIISIIAPSAQKYWQFIKFCLVGVANTSISLVVYYIFITLEVQYLLASTIAYCAGLLNGYVFSSSFVFKQQRNTHQALKFMMVNMFSLLLNLLFLFVLIDLWGISKIMAQIAATSFNVIFNFLLNKLWTFKSKQVADSH